MEWNEFCNKVKRAAGKAADKINQTADLATLQVKLSMAEHKLTEAYAKLGEIAYRHFTEEENTAESVSLAMTDVETARGEVKALQEQIAAMKREGAPTDSTESAADGTTAE